MANLSKAKINELLGKPKNQASIELAVHQEERLMMHCEPILEKYNLPPMAFRDFTNWWQSLISREKYNRIAQLIGTPLSTLSVTSDIFDQLGKFIDAQDRYIDYKFVNEDYTNDYSQYLEKINDDSFWKQKLIEALRTQINSYIVTDLPQIQTTPRPEPYNYLVSISRVHDVDINQINGNVEYIMFKQPDKAVSQYDLQNPKFALIGGDALGKPIDTMIVIDDTYYRVLSKINGYKDADGSDWFISVESAHNLGYCPVIDFWSKSIRGTNNINKKGPITSVLRKLNYLLFYRALADYMDLYGPFPVLITYEEEEEDIDDKAKEVNYGNIFQLDMFNAWDNVPMVSNQNRMGNRKIVGPGSSMTVPAPVSSQDHNMMETPMQFIGMKVDSLEHVQKRVKQLENEIVEICTGQDDEYLNEIVKNPEMLSASYERKDTIFTSIKREFERCHRFITKCRTEIRYGKGYFKASTIDYGSDYFLKDSSTLSREFKEAIEAGMPQFYTEQIAMTAVRTRYKNNPEQLARMRILSDLEPYKNLTWDQMVTLGIPEGDQTNFVIKINFLTFIAQFELEAGSIVQFGSAIPYSEKISIIKQKLNDYGSAIKWVKPIVPNGKPPKGSNGKQGK